MIFFSLTLLLNYFQGLLKPLVQRRGWWWPRCRAGFAENPESISCPARRGEKESGWKSWIRKVKFYATTRVKFLKMKLLFTLTIRRRRCSRWCFWGCCSRCRPTCDASHAGSLSRSAVYNAWYVALVQGRLWTIERKDVRNGTKVRVLENDLGPLFEAKLLANDIRLKFEI